MGSKERLGVAFHEVGHAAMVYWRREALHDRRIVINAHTGGHFHLQIYSDSEVTILAPGPDLDRHTELVRLARESDMMVLLGGPMAEFLSIGIIPKKAFRFSNEYRRPNSDTVRIRKLVRLNCGKDDRIYQFEVQERVRAILQEPRMWAGVTKAAETLAARGELDGEDVERILTEAGAQDMFGGERGAAG